MTQILATPDVLTRTAAETGEGPVIDPRTGLLAWVDIPRGDLYLTDRASGATVQRSYPTMLGAAASQAGSCERG